MNSQIALLVLTILQTSNAAVLPGFEAKSTVNPTECGQANVDESRFAAHFGVARVIENGFPWMVKILKKNESGKVVRYCSGTLINKAWILTAASCVPETDSPHDYDITLGDHKVSSRSLEIHASAAKIIRHEGYQAFNRENDIALVQLNRPISYANNTRPACVPGQDFPTDADEEMYFENKFVTYAGRLCTVLSWGETEQERKENILKHKLVSIYPRTICNAITSRNPSYFANVKQSGSRFCAKNILLQEVCKLRPGAPLLCTDDSNRYHLHGITSFGPTSCGEESLPDVYTEVAAYRNWIEENML